jgi:hypothetical protein
MMHRRTKVRIVPLLPAGVLIACGAITLPASHSFSDAAEEAAAGVLILAQTKAEKAGKSEATAAEKTAKAEKAGKAAAMKKAKEKEDHGDGDAKSAKGRCTPGQTLVAQLGRGSGGGGCM